MSSKPATLRSTSSGRSRGLDGSSSSSEGSSTEVLDCDVLLGRGKSIHAHRGNIVYRNEIKERSRRYQTEQDQERKQQIALEVIQIVRDRGGSFLRLVGDTGNWEQCPGSIVRTKVKQALRDMVKERLSGDTRRVGARKSSISPTNLDRSSRQRRAIRQPESTSASTNQPPLPPPPTTSSRANGNLTSDQLSGISQLSAFLAANRQGMTPVTTSSLGPLTGAMDNRTQIVTALLGRQLNRNIAMPSGSFPPLTQLDRSLLAATAFTQPQPMDQNLSLMLSNAALLTRQQQLLGFVSPLETRAPEIDELLRRLRHGG